MAVGYNKQTTEYRAKVERGKRKEERGLITIETRKPQATSGTWVTVLLTLLLLYSRSRSRRKKKEESSQSKQRCTFEGTCVLHVHATYMK